MLGRCDKEVAAALLIRPPIIEAVVFCGGYRKGCSIMNTPFQQGAHSTKRPFNPGIHTAMGPLIFQTMRFALVKFGGGIVQMSGSLAGNTFFRTRAGDCVRTWKKPVNPHSERQEFVRALLSYLAEYWHTELTAVQRGLWETYAAAVAMQNRLGDTIYNTGYNHWMRTCGAAGRAGLGIFEAAPTILSLPEKDATLLCSEEDVAGQTFTFTFSNLGWAPNGDPKGRLLIYQGQPQLASRNTFHGPWRYMDAFTPVEGAAGTATCDAEFNFAVGQKVWFQARIITTTGRLSELWTTPSRTIEADP